MQGDISDLHFCLPVVGYGMQLTLMCMLLILIILKFYILECSGYFQRIQSVGAVREVSEVKYPLVY